jgi:hypothetical protein
MVKRLLIGLLLFQQTIAVFAQTLADTSFIPRAEVNARAIYKDRMRDNVHLFEGSDYRPYESSNDQHPYFDQDWLVGSLFYNGSLYTNEEILYNTFKDKVIVQDYFGSNSIQVVAEKVDYFSIDGHTFVRITDASIKPGFYDLLVDGEIKLYAKRSKEFKEVISSLTIVEEFKEINRYYLFRNDKFYPVKNKRSVRFVLSDFDEELRRYIRSEKLQFRGAFESTVIKITQFCNEL